MRAYAGARVFKSSYPLVAGLFVVASVALGYFVNPWFFAFTAFTAFVGLNLFQSAFTRSCPMMWILAKAGLRK